MKKPLVVSMILVLTFLMIGFCTPAYSQDATKDDTPTFYRLAPGTYVNGWPRFTVTYPKDWMEARPRPQETFRAGAPGSPRPYWLMVNVAYSAEPLDKFADGLVTLVRMMATDVTLVSNKPSQLRDGSPAREIELTFVQNGVRLFWIQVFTKKGDTGIHVGVGSRGKVGDDLKAILYSIEFQPDKDQPVKVPPDVHAFLQGHDNAMTAHDLTRAMSHHSDKWLNSGNKKSDQEGLFRQVMGLITSQEITITDFVAEGDRVYLAGFLTFTGTPAFPPGQTPKTFKLPWWETIIKENGEWKFYGNQRNPAP